MVKDYFSCLWHCWFNLHITTLTAWLFFMMPGIMMILQHQYISGILSTVGFFALVPLLIMWENARERNREQRHVDRTNPS